jgi:hypothetical protein
MRVRLKGRGREQNYRRECLRVVGGVVSVRGGVAVRGSGERTGQLWPAAAILRRGEREGKGPTREVLGMTYKIRIRWSNFVIWPLYFLRTSRNFLTMVLYWFLTFCSL